MKRKLLAMLLVVVMAVGLLPLSACSGGTSAATMHLRRTEGTVSVSDGGGKDVSVLDNLGLYSGYGVGTQSASYAWIDLDDVKLTKLDQNSEISIEKEGKKLDILLKSGSLFFNVTEPLGDDETMNIRTSTLLVGIRGTCGWVEERSGLSRVCILEGKVDCSAEGQTVRVSAGEMAELTADGELTVKEFTIEDILAFVREDADPELIVGVEETPGPSGLEPPEPSGGPAGEILASGDCGENVTWTLVGDVLTISGEGSMYNYGTGDIFDPNYMEGEVPWNSLDFTTVVIEDGVTNISYEAFMGCTNLTSVTIPASVTSIDMEAFHACFGLTDVTIAEGVLYVDYAAFSGCTSLTDITLPDSILTIGTYAFEGCENLTGVTIPDNVTSIGGWAFQGCTSLTDVTIPASVTVICGESFDGCTSLTDVYYGGSEAQWREIRAFYTGETTFANGGQENAGLGGVTVHYNSTCPETEQPTASGICGENVTWSYIGGVLTIEGTGYMEPGRPWSDYSKEIHTVIIGDGVASIGPGAFFGCANLTDVTIPGSVTGIDQGAFSECAGLTSVIIPNGVTYIGDEAFSNCTGLTSVTIPASMAHISWGFDGCTSLTDIYYNGSEEQWGGIQAYPNGPMAGTEVSFADGGLESTGLAGATIHYNS